MQKTAPARRKRAGRPSTRGSRRRVPRGSKRRRPRTRRLPEIIRPLLASSPAPLRVQIESKKLAGDEFIDVPGFALPALEPRLQRRYLLLVQSHMRSCKNWRLASQSFQALGSLSPPCRPLGVS